MSFHKSSSRQRRTRLLGGAVALTAALAGCVDSRVPAVAETDVQAPVDAVLATSAPTPSAAPAEPTALPGPSFEAVAYTDAAAGFEFDYPAGWAVGPDQQQSRGGITAFTSWSRPTDTFPNETPPGETRLDVTVQLWDPTGDLEAFLGQRHAAWDASGIAILSEDRWTLDDGRDAVAFVVEGADGTQSYFFFTTIGDKYLALSGGGDLALLAEISHTVRPIPPEY